MIRSSSSIVTGSESLTFCSCGTKSRIPFAPTVGHSMWKTPRRLSACPRPAPALWMSGTPGNNAAEVAAPVEETTYGAHLNVGFSGKGYQLQFGYDFSLYNNDIDALRGDNPCFGLPAALPAGCGARSGNPPAPA